ncbi:TPA: hypothetical protein DD449_02645 [Candidatus Berkelbacteria bacterium]|nr:hypothetical protein [Candidatus Berkelbacteria bacterium]
MSEITLKLTIDGKEGLAVLKLTDAELLKIANDVRGVSSETKVSGSKMVQHFADIKFSIEGIKEAYDVLQRMFAEPMKAGANLEVLRSEFKGTKEDIELFNTAVSGTLTEAQIIALSNRATSLKMSMQDQAIAFAFAENAVDKYGGTVESNFDRIINAGEGMGRGLKEMGVETKVYEQNLKNLAKEQGGTLESFDAGTQKAIMLKAAIDSLGLTLDDVKGKTADHGDILEQSTVTYKAFQEQIGITLNTALIPLISHFTKIFKVIQETNPEVVGIAGSLGLVTAAGVGLNAVGILPLIFNIPRMATAMRYAAGVMKMAAAESIAAEGAMMGASIAAKGFFASIGPVGWAIIGLTALAEVWSLIASNTDDASKKEKEYLSQTNSLARLKEINKELENPNLDKTHKSLLRIERQEILKREIQTTYTSKDGKETTTNKDATPDGILGKIKTELDALEKKRPFAKSIDDLVAIDKKIIELTAKKNEIELTVKQKVSPSVSNVIDTTGITPKGLDKQGFVKAKEILPEEEAEQIKISLIDNEYERQRALADFEYNLNVKKYGDLEILKKEHSAKIREIDNAETENLSAKYSQHFSALVGMAESATNSQQNFAKQLEQYLLQSLEQYLIDYVSTAIAEEVVFAGKETAKTTAYATATAAQVGISTAATAASTATTVASMGVIAAAATPAATLTSIASFGGSAWAGYAAVAAVLGLVLALVSKGKKEGGYTGSGDPNEIAGVHHKEEYVFEADLVRGNVGKFEKLRNMLRAGIPLDQIYNSPNNGSVTKQILAVDNNLMNMQMSGGGGYDFSKIENKFVNLEKELKNVVTAFKEKQFEINMDQFRTVNKRLDTLESTYKI